MKRFIGFCFF